VRDPLEALQLTHRSGELRQVLEKSGLEPASLVIREGMDASGTAGWTAAALRAQVARGEWAGASAAPFGWLRTSGAELDLPGQNLGHQARRDPAGSEQQQGRRTPKEERR
jgi:hypothetical protein